MTKKILSSSIIQQPYFPLQAPDTLPGLGLGLESLGKKSLRAPLFSLQLTSLLLLIGCGGNSRNGGAGASITTTDSLDWLEADTPSTADADILAPPTVDQPVVLDVANPIMQDEATDEATVIDQVEPPALPQLQVTPVNNLSVDENSTALGDATSLSTSPQNSTTIFTGHLHNRRRNCFNFLVSKRGFRWAESDGYRHRLFASFDIITLINVKYGHVAEQWPRTRFHRTQQITSRHLLANNKGKIT